MTATTRPNQRERILDAALGLMSEHGSAGTSMRQLARACGVQVAAIYHYFPSKDALLAAVVEERDYGSRLAKPPEVDLRSPTATRLGAVYRYFWRGAFEEETIWRLLLGESIRGEEAVLPVGNGLLGVFHDGVSGWIRTHVPELDHPDEVAEVLIGLIFGGFIRHIFDPEVSLEALERQAVEVLVATVLGT